MPFIKENQTHLINSIQDIHKMPIYTYEEVLSSLVALSKDIYYYHPHEASLNLHFTKIMGPDFFAHMSLNKSLNIDHPYAKKLHITQENAYLHKLPFP